MDDSGIGSPGAMVQPIIDMRFPIADYIPGHRGHHHLDYVPGPEEPEQAPPSPIYIPFVPEPVYLEFLPVDDESRVFIPESDPEEDPEEDPEVDPADYPADRGDDDDDDDDAEEDEHLALADPTAIAYSADQDPYLAYRVTARMSIRPQAPRTVLSEEVAERIVSLTYYTTTTSLSYTHSTSQTLSAITLIPSPPPNGPYHMLRDLGIRAVGSRQRDALHLLSSAAGAARQVGPTIAEADLYGFADMLDAAPGRQTSKELGYGITDTWDDLLDDARYDRALLRARVNMLYRDRPFHRRTALLIEEEARLSRAAWARSMDACDQETVGDFRSAESRLSETKTVSGGTKDSEEPQDSDDRASEIAGTARICQSRATRGGPVKQFLDWVMTVATMQSVKYYGLFPASRLYRSFVLSSYSV
ncbi:hypothetical protein Tco_1547810 [Tanacetum coccineum]